MLSLQIFKDMPNLFLSHTSVDNPFVEKLAKDLKRIGVNVWFDKWEIQVGDSITWKIEDGIRENEFLGIILSPEALASEWVKSELGAAWSKQMKSKKIGVLPILYRSCNIPHFLSDRKYADFRNDYQTGLEELAAVFNIKNTETLSEENWRKFIGNTLVDWKSFREKEYSDLVTALVDLAKKYNWSVWTGGTKNLYSITCSAHVNRDKKSSISIKLRGARYMATFVDEYNPNHLRSSDFDHYIGNSVEECEEAAWRKMEDFKNKYGNPNGKAHYSTTNFSLMKNSEAVNKFANEFIQQFDWYKNRPNRPF